MIGLGKLFAIFVSALSVSGAAAAADLLFLSEDVPAGLDYDGAGAAIPTSQTGMVNLMEPLIYYPTAGVNDEGVQLLDYSRFEGRLAESWSHDEDTLTWTFNLRRGVRGCNGETFNADDVIYTFARAKTVSGAIPVGWFLSSSGSIDGFTGAVFADDEAKKLGDEVKKIDDYTIQIRQGQPNKLFLPVLTVFGSTFLTRRRWRPMPPMKIHGATTTPTTSTHRVSDPTALRVGTKMMISSSPRTPTTTAEPRRSSGHLQKDPTEFIEARDSAFW